jgi:hypothetical protein
VRVWEPGANYLQEVRMLSIVPNPPEGDVTGERGLTRGVWNNVGGDAAILLDNAGQFIDRKPYYT